MTEFQLLVIYHILAPSAIDLSIANNLKYLWLFSFNIAQIPLEKICIQILSLQISVNNYENGTI